MAGITGTELAQTASDGQLELLTPKETARLLRVSTGHLARLRVEGGGPRFVRMGRRSILYRKQDLEYFIASRICRSTSDRGAGDAS